MRISTSVFATIVVFIWATIYLNTCLWTVSSLVQVMTCHLFGAQVKHTVAFRERQFLGCFDHWISWAISIVSWDCESHGWRLIFKFLMPCSCMRRSVSWTGGIKARVWRNALGLPWWTYSLWTHLANIAIHFYESMSRVIEVSLIQVKMGVDFNIF